MKAKKLYFCPICVLLVLSICSCRFEPMISPVVPDTTAVSEESTADTTDVSLPRFTVQFDENETFTTEAEQKAAARIDPAIRKAVALLNTADMELPQVLDCDYATRPTQRDSLKYALSVEIYDTIREKVAAFEPYCFSEKDYPGVDFFNVFVSAVDALRVDHTELFLYSDGKIDGTEYRSGYFMPGDWLNAPCNDINAIRNEVAVCDAVAARILEKMPEGLTNAEKCCYFAFVLSAGVQYDYSEDYPKYDYQVYGALVKGTTVCAGYAQAFYRLCRDAGISCWYCRGTVPDGRHAWNMLDTEAGAVYIDVTWYDTDKLDVHYLDGKEQYLFMTQEDFEYFGYVQETCQ